MGAQGYPLLSANTLSSALRSSSAVSLAISSASLAEIIAVVLASASADSAASVGVLVVSGFRVRASTMFAILARCAGLRGT